MLKINQTYNRINNIIYDEYGNVVLTLLQNFIDCVLNTETQINYMNAYIDANPSLVKINTIVVKDQLTFF